jgi:ABC-type multidrug transport system fused ATPase/permease subunit
MLFECRGQLDAGAIVAFMLYLSSLSDGFNNMGSIFSSVTQAVGAADKVTFHYLNMFKCLNFALCISVSIV